MTRVLAVLLLVASSSCSALPTTRGSLANAIDDRLEPVAEGLGAAQLLLDTFRQTLRSIETTAQAASSRTAALEVSVERAQSRSANAERDLRLARDEIRELAKELGAVDPDAVADAGLGWLEALGGGAGGAAGLAGVLASIRALFRREQRLAAQAARQGGTGGPVEPPAPPTR